MSPKPSETRSFLLRAIEIRTTDGRRTRRTFPAVSLSTLGRTGDATDVVLAQAAHAILDPTAPLPKDVLQATLEFAGPRPFAMTREKDHPVTFDADGETFPLTDDPAFRRLFGAARNELAPFIAHDGRRAIGAGPEALQRALSDFLPEAERSAINLDQRLLAVRERKKLAEQELRHATAGPEAGESAVEPESLGELLTALDSERLFVRLMVENRLAVRDELERRKKEGRPKLLLMPMLEELERSATRLGELETAMTALRRRAKTGFGFVVTTALVVALLSSGGVFATGQWLHDDALRLLGARLLVLCGVGVVFAAFMRWQRLRRDVVEAKTLRREHETVGDDALKTALRVGHPLEEGQVDATRLRAAIDRVSERTLAKEIGAIIEDVADDPETAQLWRQRKMALEGGLSALAGDTANELPIAAAVRAAESLSVEWKDVVEKTLAEERRRARQDAEKDVLTEMIAQLEKEEREVRAAIEKNAGRRKAAAAFAERLNAEVLPWIKRTLGARAPESFNADLRGVFTVAPDSHTNGYIVACTELLAPYGRAARIELPRFVVDPAHDLPDDLAGEVFDALALAPAGPTLVLFRSAGAAAAAEVRAPWLFGPIAAEATVVTFPVAAMPPEEKLEDRGAPATGREVIPVAAV